MARWIFVALLAGCGSDAAGIATDGAQIFQSVCATCHGAGGKPSDAMIAKLNVRDLTAREFRARVTPALVEAQIHAGSKNKLMPSFDGVLSEPQIKAVAGYVANATFVH